ncbi:hypothetical protein Tco_0727408 [Tanacetum coccineum]|uniref:HAT C-terminal dimerisation domain-containing protein n=1 Tax=Tanacetum coccineum TaxID=301880 RepID=A0ABQ4YKS5_9ASTR
MSSQLPRAGETARTHYRDQTPRTERSDYYRLRPVLAEIEVLMRERLALQQESNSDPLVTCARSNPQSGALEARPSLGGWSTCLTTLETLVAVPRLWIMIYPYYASLTKPAKLLANALYSEILEMQTFGLQALRESTDSIDGDAITWWNAHVKTTTTEAAHAMPWAALKKMMTDKYCPDG